jgi:hypothetical protein
MLSPTAQTSVGPLPPTPKRPLDVTLVSLSDHVLPSQCSSVFVARIQTSEAEVPPRVARLGAELGTTDQVLPSQ